MVHSSRIDEKGSRVHAFMKAIQAEWDVEDEGQMDDLLGIEIKYNSNGSITLHQQTYHDQRESSSERLFFFMLLSFTILGAFCLVRVLFG